MKMNTGDIPFPIGRAISFNRSDSSSNDLTNVEVLTQVMKYIMKKRRIVGNVSSQV